MRRLLTWILVTLGIAAVARRLRRRDRADDSAASMHPADEDPAAELRQKLAASRADETAPTPADSPAGTVPVDERRAEVHERGRATIEAMRPPDEG